MSFEREVEDILINVIANSQHPGVDVSASELMRDNYTNSDFNNIFDNLVEIVEALDCRRGADFRKLAKRLSVMLICAWAVDQKLTDDLNNRDFEDVQYEVERLKRLIRQVEMEDEDDRYDRRSRRRGYDRDRRSDRRSSGGRRRDDDDDDYDDDRRSNRRRGNGGFNSRRTGRSRGDDNKPKTVVQRKAELYREEHENQEESIRSSEVRRRREEKEDQVEKSYKYVGEAKGKNTDPLTAKEEDLGFRYTEVPVGTMDDYHELGINIDDHDFIMTRPIDRTDTYRDVLYDPFAVQPVWKLNEKGLRVLRWRDFDMNIDNHVIPDFSRSSVTPRREQNHRVLTTLTHPSRRSILDIAEDADKADRKYEDDLVEWEVNNKDRAEDEQEAKPESPALQKLGNHTLTVKEPVEASSLSDMIQETMHHFADVRAVTEGTAPVEAFGSRRRFAYLAESVEQRNEIMSLIEMFTTSGTHRNSDNTIVPLTRYHDLLLATIDTIPHGLWKRINRRMTTYVNEILNISLGIGLTIDDFAADGGEITKYLSENYGDAVLLGFLTAHGQTGGRLSMLEAGKSDSDLMIYEVENTQITILPVAPDELSISSVKISDKKAYGKSALVTGDSNLKLFNALRTIWSQSTPVLGKLTPYKYIAFSDGSVFRIDRNAMGLSGKPHSDSVEYLLTQVDYC